MLSPLLPWMGSGSPPRYTSLSVLTLAQKREHGPQGPPAQLGSVFCSLKIPNQQQGIAQKPFLPSAMGRAQGPDLDFSHPDGRPNSRPHAGRQV